MSDQELELTPEQPRQSESQASTASQDSSGDKSLDEILKSESKEIEELDVANQDEVSEGDGEGSEGDSQGGEDSEGEEGDDGEDDYKPNLTYKHNKQLFPIDKRLEPLLTKETEPLIRELHEKAHGIETIKEARDEAQNNFVNLTGEVNRILNYKRNGDLQSFFESVQLTDDQIAKYILEKARISQLPPEQQAVYNEREALRKRMNVLEQTFQGAQAQSSEMEGQRMLSELDQVLQSDEASQFVIAFDAKKGQGAFRRAVMKHGAAEYAVTQKNLSPKEVVQSFINEFGLEKPSGQPKPGPQATRRVVARPKVKAIPNYGGSQSSVTAAKKPRSTDDLRKILRDMQNS
jgi:hypothetical protein